MADTCNMTGLYEQAIDYLNAGKHKRAVKSFHNLAMRGHAESANMLGVISEHIDNTNLAVAWYRLAMKLGSVVAINNLAGMYFMGRGVQKNICKAAKLYLVSAKRGGLENIDKKEVNKMQKALGKALCLDSKIIPLLEVN